MGPGDLETVEVEEKGVGTYGSLSSLPIPEEGREILKAQETTTR